MPDKKYVRYVGHADEVDAYPAGCPPVHAERGQRVEVTPEQYKALVEESGGWEDASASSSRKGD